MGNKDYLKLGSYNVICDRCSAKYKAHELIPEWTGLRVCCKCHEPRNQQDFLKAVPDSLPKPYYRPEPTESFIAYTIIPITDEGP